MATPKAHLCTVKRELAYGTPFERRRAQSYLRYKGAKVSAVLPALQRLVKLRRLALDASGVDYLAKLGPAARGMVPQLAALAGGTGKRYLRRRAVIALGRVGPTASRAIPHLIALAKRYPCEVATALGRIGPRSAKVVPALLLVLQQNAYCGFYAARALAGMTAALRPHLATVKKLFRSRTEHVRSFSAFLLLRMGVDSKRAVKRAIRGLHSRSYIHRNQLVDLLAEAGPAAADAVPTLVSIMRWAKSVANFPAALGAIGPQDPRVVKALIAALGRGNTHVGFYAAQVLVQMAKRNKAVVPALRRALRHRRRQVRLYAAFALAKTGQSLRVAGAVLKKALSDPRWARKTVALVYDAASPRLAFLARPMAARFALRGYESYVASALERMHSAKASTLTLLTPWVSTPPRHWAVLNAIERLGRRAASTTPALVSALATRRGYHQCVVARALATVAPPSTAYRALVGAVTQQLRRSRSIATPAQRRAYSNQVRCLLRALGQLGKRSPQAISLLVGWLGQGSTAVQSAAHEVLWGLNYAWQRVHHVSQLRRLLTKISTNRLHVAELLGRFGPQARAALPRLRRLLSLASARERPRIAAAIRKIQDRAAICARPTR